MKQHVNLAPLAVYGDVEMQDGNHQLRISARGEVIAVDASSIAAIRRVMPSHSLRQASDTIAEMLDAADLSLRISVRGATIATAPAAPSALSKLVGLSRVHLRIGGILRSLFL